MTTSLHVAATLEALPDIRTFVATIAERARLDRRAAYRLRLAIDEIATNIVVHGGSGQGAGTPASIDLDASIESDRLTIVVEDRGVEFDPLAHLVPGEDELTLPIAQRAIGGLGVFLAIRGVDEFRYERQGGTNRNVFVVRLERPAEEPV